MAKRGKPFHSTAYLREACGDSYFQWLADDVALYKGNEYWRLLRALHRKEFYYVNKDDSKLSEDGLYLRYMYKRNYRDYEDMNPILPSCLEVLISLAMRMESTLTDLVMQDWFWLFIKNLGLEKFDDDDYDECGGTDAINYILSKWLTRTYRHDGKKYNIFPCLSEDLDFRSMDMLHQGYLYVRDMYGPDLIYDFETNQCIG